LTQIDYGGSLKKHRIEIGAIYEVEKAIAKNEASVDKGSPNFVG